MTAETFKNLIETFCLEEDDDILIDMKGNNDLTETLYQKDPHMEGSDSFILVKMDDPNKSPKKIPLSEVNDLWRRPPHIIPIDKKHYRLDEKYSYKWKRPMAIGYQPVRLIKNRITIPEGYVYDGASVPRLLWTISGILPDGRQRLAALVHDWIYKYKGLLPENSQYYQNEDGTWKILHGKWSRKDADKLFARILKESGVTKFKRRWMYRAVHWFGWTYWWDR